MPLLVRSYRQLGGSRSQESRRNGKSSLAMEERVDICSERLNQDKHLIMFRWLKGLKRIFEKSKPTWLMLQKKELRAREKYQKGWWCISV